MARSSAAGTAVAGAVLVEELWHRRLPLERYYLGRLWLNVLCLGWLVSDADCR